MQRRLRHFSLVLLMVCACFCACLDRRDRAPAATVSGTIENDETHVASRYGGRVETIHVREGASLHSAQPILDLEAGELRARRDQAAAVLAEMEAGARPEEIAAAKSDWESLASEVEFARVDAKRTVELFQEKTISESERDRAVTRLNSLEKSAAAAKARHELLLAGTRPERKTQAKAQLAEIDAQLSEMKLIAPTQSVLEVLHVRVGDVVAPNREVATLLLTQHLWVRVYVPEPWIGHLRLGSKVTVRVDSFPGEIFSGEIEQINRAAEFTPRNVQTIEERIKQVFGIKVRLNNESDKLRAGMSADVTFSNIPDQMKTVR